MSIKNRAFVGLLAIASFGVVACSSGDDSAEDEPGFVAGSGGASGKGGSAGKGGSSGKGGAGTAGKGGTGGTGSAGKGGEASAGKGGSGEGGSGEGGSGDAGEGGSSSAGKGGSTSKGGSAGKGGSELGGAGKGGSIGKGGSSTAGAGGDTGEGGKPSLGGSGGIGGKEDVPDPAGAGGDSGAGGVAGTGTGGSDAGGTGGTGTGGTGTGGSAAGTCATIAITAVTNDPVRDYNMDFAFAPTIGGSAQDLARFELYDTAVTTADLSKSPENNYKSCDHCVRVFEDVTDTGVGRQYFADKGTLKILANDGIKTTLSVSGVQMSEVTIGADFTSTPVAGGQCLAIKDGTFEVQRRCVDVDQCASGTKTNVCDPQTFNCSTGCTASAQCADDEGCFRQTANATVGACYTYCDPGVVGACGSDACSQLDVSGDYGICERSLGAGINGESCVRVATGSSCAKDFVCADEGTETTPKDLCRQTCDGYAATTGCPSGTICDPFGGLCLGTAYAATFGVTTKIGSACGSDKAGFLCDPSNGGYRGLCDDDGSGPVCRKLVGRAGKGCPAGTVFGTFEELYGSDDFAFEEAGLCYVP
jgi:hypothetical protein